jgi:hypothetical protein
MLGTEQHTSNFLGHWLISWDLLAIFPFSHDGFSATVDRGHLIWAGVQKQSQKTVGRDVGVGSASGWRPWGGGIAEIKQEFV